MNSAQLAVAYLICGVVCAFVLARRQREAGQGRLLQLALALLMWPLWLPVALAQSQSTPCEPGSNVAESEQALWQGYQAVKDTPLEKLLPLESVERIALELRRVGERDRALSRILTQPGFDLAAVRARIAELERKNAAPRALAVAHRYRENIERLAALQVRNRQLLDELGDWLSTMRTQLVLARYSGASAEGVSDIFAEICARVEVLGSTLDEQPLCPPAAIEPAWQSTFS